MCFTLGFVTRKAFMNWKRYTKEGYQRERNHFAVKFFEVLHRALGDNMTPILAVKLMKQ